MYASVVTSVRAPAVSARGPCCLPPSSTHRLAVGSSKLIVQAGRREVTPEERGLPAAPLATAAAAAALLLLVRPCLIAESAAVSKRCSTAIGRCSKRVAPALAFAQLDAADPWVAAADRHATQRANAPPAPAPVLPFPFITSLVFQSPVQVSAADAAALA